MIEENWIEYNLGEIADNISIRVDNPSQSNLERFVGLEHLNSGEVIIRRWGSTRNVTSSMKGFQIGDTLVARRNAHLRRASQAQFEGVCSGDAYVLRENQSVAVPGILKYIFNSKTFWNYANANADGSMSSRVKWRHLESLKIKLPPKRKQEKIVELLDACYATYIQYIECLESSKNYRGKLVSTYLLNSKNMIPLGDVYDTQLGKTMTKDSKSNPKQYYYLKNRNVKWGELDTEDLSTMHFTEAEKDKYAIREGDILLCEGGEVGRCTVSEFDIDAYFQNSIHRLRLKEDQYYPSTLFVWVMKSMADRKMFLRYTGVGTIPHLVQTNLRKIPLPISSKPRMKELNQRIESINNLIERFQLNSKTCLGLLNSLIEEYWG